MPCKTVVRLNVNTVSMSLPASRRTRVHAYIIAHHVPQCSVCTVLYVPGFKHTSQNNLQLVLVTRFAAGVLRRQPGGGFPGSLRVLGAEALSICPDTDGRRRPWPEVAEAATPKAKH